MSQENVDLVRRGFSNPDSFWALLDEHVVFDTRSLPHAAVIDIYGTPVLVGRNALIDATRSYWGTWDDYHLDAEELIDAGSSVVGVVRERGRGKGGGIPFDRRWAQVWTFSRGRIIRMEAFSEKAEALEAAGLRE
jgi:ketosteroid isomerase-like protein